MSMHVALLVMELDFVARVGGPDTLLTPDINKISWRGHGHFLDDSFDGVVGLADCRSDMCIDMMQ